VIQGVSIVDSQDQQTPKPSRLFWLGWIVAIVVIVRRRRNAPIPPPANLTAAEESRLSELMREG